LEAFGGQGYIEDTGLPTYFRDAQVLSIWEGTTNILSLDALRSIEKSKGESIKIFHKQVTLICEKAKSNEKLRDKAEIVLKNLNSVCSLVKPSNAHVLANGARELSFSLYRLFTGFFLMSSLKIVNILNLFIYYCLKQHLSLNDV
jgi:hypothetical protein